MVKDAGFESEQGYMITVKFDEECEMPDMTNPSLIKWQVKRLKNTTTNDHIVDGMNREVGKFRINKEMNLYEKEHVYKSIENVLQSRNDSNGERKWIESSLNFHMIIIGTTDNNEYKYSLEGSDGHIYSIELIEKSSVTSKES